MQPYADRHLGYIVSQEFSQADVSAVTKALEGKPELKNFQRAVEYIKYLENMADNAHDALNAVIESGGIMNEDVYEMARLGLDNKPQAR